MSNSPNQTTSEIPEQNPTPNPTTPFSMTTLIESPQEPYSPPKFFTGRLTTPMMNKKVKGLKVETQLRENHKLRGKDDVEQKK